ncbi:hypothetical protein QVD99_003199 [Batrachochytrium dendrobatidis]|nr:hypothetical protein QVD99_003199 [Batrachochytrium dendrobatidis]
MKLSVAVLSSILLVCSVTTANPVVPSTTASTDHVSSTVVPSSTTSTESNPSTTPNTDDVNLGSLDSLSVDIEDLLENYSERKHDHDRHTKECELIKFQFEDQQKLVKHLRERFDALKLELQGNGHSDSEYSDDDEMERVGHELEDGYSKLIKLERKDKKCSFKNSYFTRQLKLVQIDLVKSVFGTSFNIELFDKQLLLILSHSSVKQYLEGLCSGEQSSACTKGFGQSFPAERRQNPNDDSFEEIDLGDSSDGKRQRQAPRPQTQSGFRSFGQRLSSFKHRVSSGIRKAFSRFGDRFRSLVERFRCGNRSEC